MRFNETEKEDAFKVIEIIAPTDKTLAENIGAFSEEKAKEAIESLETTPERAKLLEDYLRLSQMIQVTPEIEDNSAFAETYNNSLNALTNDLAM